MAFLSALEFRTGSQNLSSTTRCGLTMDPKGYKAVRSEWIKKHKKNGILLKKSISVFTIYTAVKRVPFLSLLIKSKGLVPF